jgi:hypothetical protein
VVIVDVVVLVDVVLAVPMLVAFVDRVPVVVLVEVLDCVGLRVGTILSNKRFLASITAATCVGGVVAIPPIAVNKSSHRILLYRSI